MDNEEELLDDKHFNDCASEFDDLDADAENKLLGLSDDEGNNFEYEYVDEDGKPVVLNENSETEYEVVHEEENNQNEQDVLDLEIEHDLEFDDSAVSETPPIESTIKNEHVNEIEDETITEEDGGQIDEDSSESDDENTGRGRFRSERPNIVQLSARNKRNNIPDSLDDVLRDDMRGGNYRNQRQFKRENVYNQRQYEQRDRYNPRDYSHNKERNSGPLKTQQQNNSQNYAAGNTNDVGMSNNLCNVEQNYQTNASSTDNQATGPRKILINPHFKGSLPINDAPSPNLWNTEPNQMNYNEGYRQNSPQQQQQLLSSSSFNNQSGYGGQELPSGTQGLLPVPNQLNTVPQMRLPLMNNTSGPNESQWNRNNNFQALPPPHQLMPPSNLLPPNSTGMINQPLPHMMFPPPLRERPPPLMQNTQFFNDNRQFQMRQIHSPNNPQWNSAPSNSNYDQFNNSSDSNQWRAPNNQQSLINTPSLMGKFPDIRQPPPNLQMQAPRPMVNFNAPPPNFSNNLRPDVSGSNWSPRPNLHNSSINNYQQIPPTPLIPNQSTAIKTLGGPLPFRLPLPTPNVPLVNRFNHPKSLLGNPVMMPTPRQTNNFILRTSNNLGIGRKEVPNWNQPNSGTSPQMQFRKRAHEDKTGVAMKHQKTTFMNKQGNLVRRKPMVVNANIKEVKIVENISPVEKTKTKPVENVDEVEDEETKRYRAQIELQNQKRNEILRIKEERREMMALQRRKMMLKQSNLSESNIGSQEVNSSVVPAATPIQMFGNMTDSHLVPIPASPTVKKRVMVRRVQTATRPPRKTVAAPVKVGAAFVSLATPPVTTQIKAVAVNQVAGTVPIVKRPLLGPPGTISVNKTATVLEANQDAKRQGQIRQLRTVKLENQNDQAQERMTLQVTNAGVIDPSVKKVNRIVAQAGKTEVGTAGQIQNQKVKIVNPVNTKQTSVLIENLSLATTEASLRRLCQFYGSVESVEMKKDNRTAIVKFELPTNAKIFVDRCQRRMVDLSLIAVSLVNP